MILAIGPEQRPFVFGQRNPNKEAVLAAMKSFEPTAYAEGFARDLVTGKVIDKSPDKGYRYGELIWTGEQIYNFEHHDLVLNPAFCDAILAFASNRS